jgi:hypothetical protein
MSARRNYSWPWPRLIHVPFHIHPSKQAAIVGAEYIARHQGNPGWLYFVRFIDGGTHWRASEAEIVKWQEEGNGEVR